MTDDLNLLASAYLDGEATAEEIAQVEADADALPVIPDRRLAHGDTLAFGDITLDVIHLRGHTPGPRCRNPDPRTPARWR